MEKAELMQEKIEEQRKLPDEIKQKLNNITFLNLIISILIMTYLIIINILYIKLEVNSFENTVKILTLALGIVDVILFEISYRKDSIPFWVHSLEVLIACVLTLAIPYTYMYLNDVIKSIVMFSPLFFAIYYVIKNICIHIYSVKKYQNNLSDVKEIVKDEEEGYLEEKGEK